MVDELLEEIVHGHEGYEVNKETTRYWGVG